MVISGNLGSLSFFGAVWCGLVRFSAVWCYRDRPISDGISLQFFEIRFYFADFVYFAVKNGFPVSPLAILAPWRLKPGFRAQLEMIPGFPASLFDFMIGFRIPLCLSPLCQKVPPGKVSH
ncbi:MAG: hypothetical protein WCH99_19850 [Verrucomicrobiota bacterium]